MTGLLSKAGSKLTVKQLLDTLAECMEFEASVMKKYSTPVTIEIHPELLSLTIAYSYEKF